MYRVCTYVCMYACMKLANVRVTYQYIRDSRPAEREESCCVAALFQQCFVAHLSVCLRRRTDGQTDRGPGWLQRSYCTYLDQIMLSNYWLPEKPGSPGSYITVLLAKSFRARREGQDSQP